MSTETLSCLVFDADNHLKLAVVENGSSWVARLMKVDDEVLR